MKVHVPTREEEKLVEETGAAIVTALLEQGLGSGYAGACLTVAMGNLMGMLSEEGAATAMAHHVDNVRQFSRLVRRDLAKLKRETRQ